MLARMTHIALHVASIDLCTEFYQQFCGLIRVSNRHDDDDSGVIWLSEPGREQDFVLVLIPGGKPIQWNPNSYQHLGFALDSKKAVDQIAKKALHHQCLIWEPRQEPFPTGYYCGLRDPNGNAVEFSYGQPLGPGSA